MLISEGQVMAKDSCSSHNNEDIDNGLGVGRQEMDTSQN